MLTLRDRVFSNIKNKEALSFTQASAFLGKKKYLPFIFLDITMKPDGPTAISNFDISQMENVK